MPKTTINRIAPVGPYPAAVAANSLDIAFTAADVANGNQVKLTGRELLLVKNGHAADPHNFTIESVPDGCNREADITAYSLAAGEYAAFWLGSITGWRQTDGYLYLSADDASIMFAIITIP